MSVVDFIIVGAQKAGTSAMHNILRQHPEIAMPASKELHYFDTTGYPDFRPDYSKYEEKFTAFDQNKIIGESTPNYLYIEECPKRIWEYNKYIKLILILRNPIDRAWSHWNMNLKKGRGKGLFIDALQRELLYKSDLDDAYIKRGNYYKQIERYRKYFNDDQMLILKYEEFVTNPDKIVFEILDFLGANGDGFKYENEIKNKTHYKSQLLEYDRTFLQTVFEDDIKQLNKLLPNFNTSDWK